MTIADTSVETIGSLFFSQVRNMSVSSARRKYRNDLQGILDAYAPDASRLLRQKLAVYR